MLPSRRQHRFQKISVSVVHLDFVREIAFGNDPQGAPMALKTCDALKDAFSSSQEVSWGAPGWPWPLGTGTALGPLGTHFTSILDSFETHVGSILDVLGAIFNKVS